MKHAVDGICPSFAGGHRMASPLWAMLHQRLNHPFLAQRFIARIDHHCRKTQHLRPHLNGMGNRERPGCSGLARCTRSRGEVTAARCPIGTSPGCTGVARDAIQCVVALRWHAASDPMSETAGLAHAAIAATGGTEGLSANGPAASRQFAQGAGLCLSRKDAGTYPGNVRGFGTRLASTASISPWVTASTRTVGLRTSAVRMMPRRTSSCLCT